ncbi:MAG: hypothetical protein JW779_01505 [Candidatus Thorarchaeota archaeon]|nr:hypothetical protein [Candidatus Thorarchaeota archaeon]
MNGRSLLGLVICITLFVSMFGLVNTIRWSPQRNPLMSVNYKTTSGVSNGNPYIDVTYPETGLQTATTLVHREDGSYVLGGYLGNALGGGMRLLGADQNGVYEWNETYCPGASLNRLIECHDGGFALLGMILPNGSEYNDWILVRTNSSYSYSWNQTYGGSGYDYAAGLVELEDGFMIGGSFTNTSTANMDYMLIRTDVNGTALWNVTFGDVYDQWCRQIIRCTDGGYLLVGYSWNPTSSWDIYLVKTNENGTFLWSKLFATPYYDQVFDVVEIAGTGFALAGGISDGQEGDLLLLRVDFAGNHLYNKTFGHGTNQTYDGMSIVQTPDLGFCIIGRNHDFNSSFDTHWLLRTDSSCIKIWEYPVGDHSVHVFVLLSADEGGFVTAGSTGDFGTEEWDFQIMLFPELSWIREPMNQLWYTNSIPVPTYKLNATSAAPLQSWIVNDTHFQIDNQGLLTNATNLDGTYNLHITVTDYVGNSLEANIMILAVLKTLPTSTTTTSATEFPIIMMTFIVTTLGLVVGAVVLVLVIRKKRGF